MFDDRYLTHRIGSWLADRVPGWFRTRWPLKGLYWQQEDMYKANKYAKELSRRLKWM